MDHRLIVSILFLLIIGKLENVNGYKWVSLKLGDTLPKNKVLIDSSQDTYIGRARHFAEILPAIITANGSAFISSCHKETSKVQFEVLTTTSDECEWKSYSSFENIDYTALRVGTARNGEPIFVGAWKNYYYNYNRNHITSIYLNKNDIYHWSTEEKNHYHRTSSEQQGRFLSCETKTKWIDSSAMKLPNNTVSGGKSEDGHDIYVAQLKEGCEIVTGQAIPEMGTATAFLYDGRDIQDFYCQVLVGEPNEYTWVAASDGEIPDFAVANGKYLNEITYVARVNKTITHLTHSEGLRDQFDYDILVRNQLL